MDLVDEEHLALLQVRSASPARSPGFSITGPAVGADRHAQLVGDDVRQRRLAEAGRAVEQHVIERLAALPAPPRSRRAGSRGRAPGRCSRRACAGAARPRTARRRRRGPRLTSRDRRSSPSSTLRSTSRSACSNAASAVGRCSDRVDRLLGQRPLVAEVQQRRQQIVAQLVLRPRRSPAACAGRRQRRRQPILQLEPDALGGLLADAGDRASAARRPARESRG